MKIGDEIVEQIRSNSDIVDIVGEVVDLRPRGKNLVGLCPFHDEKTPSFNVSPDMGIFKCFGCGKSGNSITFMMDYHGLSFPEALKSLADRLGIAVEFDSAPSPETKDVRESVVKALAYATKIFRKNFDTDEGKKAYDYFLKRGFGAELIKEFQLGYALNSWDATLKMLEKAGFSGEIIEQAGLAIKRENGGFYDRFRGRAIFPIHDFMGRVIAFGGRIMTDDKDQPKYINSPQSIVYDKSKSLYGIYQSKNFFREEGYALLAEGYADVLSLHQAGFRTAVASSGTSLTPLQLKELSRFVKKLFIVYDADTAGLKAADKGLDAALERGFEVKAAVLPKGEDPDSFIQKNGAEAFEERLDQALNFVDFKLNSGLNSGNFDSPRDKADALRSLISAVSKIPDRLQHDEYLRLIASRMKLNENQIYRLYEEKATEERKSKFRASRKVNADSDTLDSTKKKKSIRVYAEEKQILKMALRETAMFFKAAERIDFSEKALISEDAKRIFYYFWSKRDSDTRIVERISSDDAIEQADKEFAAALAIETDTPSDLWKTHMRETPKVDFSRVFLDSMIKLELRKKLFEKKEILEKMKNVQNNSEQIAMLKLVRELDAKIGRLKDKLNYEKIRK